VFGWTAEQFIEAVFGWLAGQLATVLDWLWGLLSVSMFVSPDVTVLPQVQQASTAARLAANSVMALVVMTIGLLTIINGGSEQARYTLKDLLPRFVTGMLLANFATVIIAAAISAANAVTGALTGLQFTSPESVAQLKRILAGAATDTGHMLLLIVLNMLLGLALGALLLTWLVRLAVLILCAAVGPVALACHVFPVTATAADAWWRALTGALLTQVLQAAALNLAWGTLLSPQGTLPALGLPGDPNGLVNLAIAAFVTFQVARIPRYVARLLSMPTRPSTLGYLVKAVVVHQVMDGLRTVRRGGRRG
jgi:hypothetical protein